MARRLSSTARLAKVSAMNPWKTVGIWVAVLVLAMVLQSVVKLNSTTDVKLLNNPESVQGWDLLVSEGIRPERQGTETVIVRSASTTVDDPAFQQEVQHLTDVLRSNGKIVSGATNAWEMNAQHPGSGDGLISGDRKTTIIPVTLTGSLEDGVKHGGDFLNIVHAERANAPNFQVLTVGDGSLNHEINKITEKDLARGESFGAGFALIILMVVFAAVVAAFVPIVLAIIAIVVAFALAALVSQGSELSFFVTNIITMIGLAVGIDYALFVVDRYREERRHGNAKIDAITQAGATASRAVLFSGMTVVFALAGLIIVPNNIFRSLGIGAIFVVIAAVAATMTLIPAVISLLGDRLDWPRKRHYPSTPIPQDVIHEQAIHTGFWGKMTSLVMGKPVISLVLAVAFLLLCAAPYLNFQPGLNGASTLPDDVEAKQAYSILATDFSAGIIEPVEIVVHGPQDDPTVRQGITQLQSALATATNADGQQLFGQSTVQISPNHKLALVSVPLKVAPDEPVGNDAIKQLRNDIVPPIERQMSGATILVTGNTAGNVDFMHMRDTYTPIVFAFVLGLSFLLLLIVFRSLVIATKAIVMNLLSVGAAYGLLVWVFQEGHLTGFFGFQRVDAIEAWLPLFLFSILFGLSMDYHVFLLSRIKEAYDHTHRNRESVAIGLQRTARIITGAALIMVSVFAGFAAGSLVFLQQVGFGLGVAVLLDATIVRSVLVPSAMTLLGDRNWYLPKWLQWLPEVHLEGPADVREPVEVPEGAVAD